MNFDDITINGDRPLVLVSEADLEQLESHFWFSMPDGYRQFITRFGEGLLAESFIRIYPPWRISAELSAWRQRINRHWFWDDDIDALPKARASECVIIGDTLNGDELVFHPSRPQRLFVLSHDSDHVLIAGANLADSIEWMCRSHELVDPISSWDFDPFDSRVESGKKQDADSVDDPADESLGEIIELGKQWAERHATRSLARNLLKKNAGKGTKTVLLYEGLLFSGEMPYEYGYTIAHRIIDRASGLETGICRFHKGEDSYGSICEPNRENRAKLSGNSAK